LQTFNTYLQASVKQLSRNKNKELGTSPLSKKEKRSHLLYHFTPQDWQGQIHDSKLYNQPFPTTFFQSDFGRFATFRPVFALVSTHLSRLFDIQPRLRADSRTFSAPLIALESGTWLRISPIGWPIFKTTHGRMSIPTRSPRTQPISQPRSSEIFFF